MGNCLNSKPNIQLDDNLDSILCIAPQDWTQGQVIKWLQLTHDGDLSDLVEPFRGQKISGVTFVRLTDEMLKTDLNVTQFGLRDGFIAARNKLLKTTETSTNNQQKTTTTNQPNDGTVNTDSNTSDNIKKNIDDIDKEKQEKNIDGGGEREKDITTTKKQQSQQSTINTTINVEKKITSERSDFSEQQSKTTNPNTKKNTVDIINNEHDVNDERIQQHQYHQMNNTNHLVTKPIPTADIRHNQSFDNNGGYDELPKEFISSPITANKPMVNGMSLNVNRAPIGFANMPQGTFDNLEPEEHEEDNYASIDIHDLNGSNGPQASLPPHQLPPQHQNGGYYAPNMSSGGIGGMSVNSSPNDPRHMNIQSQIDSSAPPQSVSHNHNQTGSNYDELPLEFISSINPSTHNEPTTNNQPIQPIMNGYGGGHNSHHPLNNQHPTMAQNGYQSVQQNGGTGSIGTGPYENINFDDGISSTTDNNKIHHYEHGSCVTFYDQRSGKNTEAQIERIDNLNNMVYLKCLKAPYQKLSKHLNEIKPLPPPRTVVQNENPNLNKNLISMNDPRPRTHIQAGPTLRANNHVDINDGSSNGDTATNNSSGNGRKQSAVNEKSSKEKKIHEFARHLWKTLHKIDVKTIADAHNEPIRGFSGKELVRHVKKHINPQKEIKLSDKEVIQRCNELVSYQYIRLIASAKGDHDGVGVDDADNNNNNNTHTNGEDNKSNDDNPKENKFANSEKYLYQFENEKHREFIKDDQPDRRAWTRGTKVQIYSATLGGWKTGTVVEVNNDTLTITYGPPTQQMRKTLDRYQDDLVKSTDIFISNRKGWQKDSEIEVYSHGQHIWCQGRIEEVLAAKENQPVDIFRVFYTNNDDKDFSKYVDRWSPDLREVQQLSPKLAKYKKGTKVRVWSNSKQTWVPGTVIDVVPTYEVVNVRYGDHEKLVPVSSDDIKLVNEEND